MQKNALRAVQAVGKHIPRGFAHYLRKTFKRSQLGIAQNTNPSAAIVKQDREPISDIAHRSQPQALVVHDPSVPSREEMRRMPLGQPVESTIIVDDGLTGPVLVDTYIIGMPEIRQPNGTRLLYELVPDLKPGERADDYTDRGEIVPFRRRYRHVTEGYCLCDNCSGKEKSPVMITR